MNADEIYVHNKVEGLTFNAIAYCLMKVWHLPDIEGIGKEDRWFAVPAVKIGPIYNIINANFEFTALMILDADGRLIKSHRVNLNTAPKIDGFELEEIKRQAFDIPMWERANQAPFPYESMFEGSRIAQRYQAASVDQQRTVNNGASSNQVYNKIRSKVQPRPCNCGKK